MRIFQVCALALCILLTLNLAWARVTNQTVDFSRYPQPSQKPFGGNELSDVITSHTHDCVLNDNRTAIIQIFSFQLVPEAGGQNTWMVKQNGREFEARNVWNWAVQNGCSRQLTEVEIASLSEAIKSLPPDNVYPALDHLTIVSFRENSKWITRCYDQAHLPESLKKIHEILDKSKMLTTEELDAEALADTKKMVVAARTSNPELLAASDLKMEDAAAKSEAIFVGTLNFLEGPRDAQLGEARYYGAVDISQVLHGPVRPPRNWVAINAILLSRYHEEESNIFFAIATDYAHPRTTVGTQFTVIKFLPATNSNIEKVKKLIDSKPDSK